MHARALSWTPLSATAGCIRGCRMTVWVGCVLGAIGYGGLYAAASGALDVSYGQLLGLAFVAGERAAAERATMLCFPCSRAGTRWCRSGMQQQQHAAAAGGGGGAGHELCIAACCRRAQHAPPLAHSTPACPPGCQCTRQREQLVRHGHRRHVRAQLSKRARLRRGTPKVIRGPLRLPLLIRLRGAAAARRPGGLSGTAGAVRAAGAAAGQRGAQPRALCGALRGGCARQLVRGSAARCCCAAHAALRACRRVHALWVCACSLLRACRRVHARALGLQQQSASNHYTAHRHPFNLARFEVPPLACNAPAPRLATGSAQRPASCWPP